MTPNRLTFASAAECARRANTWGPRSGAPRRGLVVRSLPFALRVRAFALWSLLAAVWFSALQAQPDYQATPAPVPQAPPPAIVESRAAIKGRARQAVAVASQPTLYSIGEPTDEEQLIIEWLNWARANPVAEGQRLGATTDPDVLAAYDYFNLDVNLMLSQFAALDPVPPLAPNAALTVAARGHSQDMLTNAFQDHRGSDGTGPGDRVTAAGYVFSSCAENIYAYAKSPWHAHAGFEADWGPGPAGMQDPPGHRLNIHSGNFHEVGVGLAWGTNGVVGPLLVTQDFAKPSSLNACITGVAYYDLNTNGCYDAGEGLGGVKVTVSGANYHAVTVNSGGYAVPVPQNGPYTVTFSADGLADEQSVVTVTDLKNVKVDFVPVYQPPAITGKAEVLVGRAAAYQFGPVGGATAYQWRQVQRVSTNLVEDAEDGLADFTADTTPGYSVVVTDVKSAGNQAFHLAQPGPTLQTLTLNRLLRLNADSKLEFMSRLGWATASQIARAQLSTDHGKSWQDLWSQAGQDNVSETAFQLRSVSLAGFAESEALVRFAYDFTSGSYYSNTDAGVGFYLDNITLSNIEELVAPVISAAQAGQSFAFVPPNAGDFALSARAMVSGRWLDWGPAKLVQASVPVTPTAEMRLAMPALGPGNQASLDFEVTSGVANEYVLARAPAPLGPWTEDTAATLQQLAAGRFRFLTQTGGASQQYYRVIAR